MCIRDRDSVHKPQPFWREGSEVEPRESIYLSLHCHHQNDSCIKTGSDYESHFNVSLIVRDKVTWQCPQTTTCLKRKESRSGIEPRPFCLPLGQTSSQWNPGVFVLFESCTEQWRLGWGLAESLWGNLETWVMLTLTGIKHSRGKTHTSDHKLKCDS